MANHQSKRATTRPPEGRHRMTSPRSHHRKDQQLNRHPTFKCTVCRARALVRSSEELTREVIEIRYACSSHSCGHTWVNHNTFIRTVSPPAHGSHKEPIYRLGAPPAPLSGCQPDPEPKPPYPRAGTDPPPMPG